MLSAVSYCNPWVDKGTLRDLTRIETSQIVKAVALTAIQSTVIVYLASYAGLAAVCVALPVAGLCAIVTFRVYVAYVASQIPIVQKTGAEIKKEQYQAIIQRSLQPNERLGTAIDNGDCFYDAIAKLLREKEIQATVESLRNDIGDALKDFKWEAHIRE
ncbi:MAG TPA: hypothetical protein VIJ14_00695, partial [Rhabdochlamydiaceae bacterium]